jgi:hypothetical protein
MLLELMLVVSMAAVALLNFSDMGFFGGVIYVEMKGLLYYKNAILSLFKWVER